jgi:hypothetical protein
MPNAMDGPVLHLPAGEAGYVQFLTDPARAAADPRVDVDLMVTRPIIRVTA